MTKVLRVGMIGAGGGMSRLRGKALLQNPRARVVAACSTREEHWPRVREMYGLEPVKEFHRLVSSDEVDAVVVSTPNVFHYEPVLAALQHGKHVLCEYPLVQTLDQYDTLVRLAGEKGVVLHDGLTPVIEDYHLAFKEHIARVGRPLTLTYFYHVGRHGWYWQERLAGDPFTLLHVHQIAQAMDLFGEVESVYAAEVCFKGVMHHTPPNRVETGEARGLPAILRFRLGPLAILDLGVGVRTPPPFVITLVGDEGMLEFQAECNPPKFLARLGKQVVVEKDVPFRFADWFKQDTDNFVAEILDGAAPLVPLARGRDILRVALLCSESAKGRG